MSKAVKFEMYGGTEVLQVVEVADREPAAGQVRVRVVAASINPGEAGIRSGAMHAMFPAHFPEGEGSDFAGVVEGVGSGVDFVSVGDEVIGFSDERSAHAEYVVIAADRVIPKPHGAAWDAAASLYVAGTTAFACVSAVDVRRGDTVVVAGAAGGVGVIATQLAVRAGAAVIATASEENHAFLRSVGAIPVAYGKGLIDRIRKIVPDGVDAFIDTHGDGNVELARALGVENKRINTLPDRAAVKKYGVKANGMAAVPARETMIQLARMLGAGELVVPVYAHYPLTEVRAAYERLAKGHGLGKIVLDVSEPRTR
ncbi:NADP-dependent oxidoreductase [Galbitalea soli]|uniref:NADP-dependent oxidoreductase n=1 Tax=Galbitalea soli TaxID=1268042 RepID=A0A7C9TPI6_9MICO|nr:NADP-dependent oxidoreductase [Galbitalea soli]NEM90777.1 NADP-dependent oxidoreductase [Galbitalea soli]NYJ31495.1 NADPH:quinone reductase-like Zn-dependent oxidoreductase [Galbitalea soli]